MSEKTAVIGFDLGHGESALVIIDDAYSLRGKGGIQPRQVFNEKSQPTVLATLQDGRKVWGVKAVKHSRAAPGQVLDFEICFKAKPGREQTDAVIQEFAACVYGDARALLNGQLGNHVQWFIGCPSAWDKATRTAYERIFSRAGIGAVTIVRESRAAFTYHFEKKGLIIGDLQEPTVVLDFGSSTLDATLAVGLRDEELDPGCPLGASWIDKAILHWNLKHCSRDDFPAGKQDGEKIAAFLSANRFMRGRVELQVREAKEYYFNKQDIKQDIYTDASNCYEPGSIKIGDHKFRIVLHGEMMQELLNTQLEEIVPELLGDGVPDDVRRELVGYSWLGRCRKFLEDIGSKLEAQGINRTDVQHVLLTGGASRMEPVRQLVREFFGAGQMLDGDRDGKDKVEYDTEPELCIARGLACWGRTAIQGEAFRDEVNTLLFGKFTVTDEALAEMRQAGVPDPVVAKVRSLRSLPDKKRHPVAFHTALAAALGADDYEKHEDVIIDKTPLVDRRLLNVMATQFESAKFEEVVGDKAAEIALSRLRSWHNGNTRAAEIGPSIARELRQWSESVELLNVVKSRVERFESAIRKEVNDVVRPVMETYQITNVTFMDQTVLFDKFAAYYKSDVESLAKIFESSAPFEDFSDSVFKRWMQRDSDLLGYVRQFQTSYSTATLEELIGMALPAFQGVTNWNSPQLLSQQALMRGSGSGENPATSVCHTRV
jgi:molecular chaperone DnaK (HSP70)